MADIDASSLKAMVVWNQSGVSPGRRRHFSKLNMSRIEKRFLFDSQRTHIAIQRPLRNNAAQRRVGFSCFAFLRIEVQRTIASVGRQIAVTSPRVEEQIGERRDGICPGDSARNTSDDHR